MYKTCPKCNYTRQPNDTHSERECPACGLQFDKWLKNLVGDAAVLQTAVSQLSGDTLRVRLRKFFCNPKTGIGQRDLILYLIIYVVFVIWGISFVSMDISTNEIGRSWFHNVNLIFHEAGHVLFMPFGRTATILGGSVFQVLLPLILLFSFLIYNRDGFSASICLWWTGQSLMDVAPYIADARALQLPLLGVGPGVDAPGMHDWANFLRPRGWLNYDTTIAYWVDLLGAGLLLLGLVWGGLMLYLYYQQLGTSRVQ